MDVIDNIKEKVDLGISAITSKSKETIELVKLQSELNDLNKKKEIELKKMGTLTYQLLNTNELEPEKLKETHTSLQEIDARIISVKEKIKEIQQTTAKVSSPAKSHAFAYCECGGHLKETAKFCPRCGTNVQEIIENAKKLKTSSSKKCPECGEDISGQAKFCSNCGKKLN